MKFEWKMLKVGGWENTLSALLHTGHLRL